MLSFRRHSEWQSTHTRWMGSATTIPRGHCATHVRPNLAVLHVVHWLGSGPVHPPSHSVWHNTHTGLVGLCKNSSVALHEATHVLLRIACAQSTAVGMRDGSPQAAGPGPKHPDDALHSSSHAKHARLCGSPYVPSGHVSTHSLMLNADVVFPRGFSQENTAQESQPPGPSIVPLPLHVKHAALQVEHCRFATS